MLIQPAVMTQTHRDLCKGVRQTYGAMNRWLAANYVAAAILSGAPTIYLTGFIIYQSTQLRVNYASQVFASPSYIILSNLILTWAVSAITVWKKMPNLLTVCIFIYNCIGHWAFITFMIVIFYGSSVLAGGYISYLAAVLLPEIIILMVSADLLRALRTRLFDEINAVSAATAALGDSAV
jgi:hypothetical protein